MNDKITAVILAGGLGTRLQTVISDRPKVMALVNGRPFLTYLFDQLIRAKFSQVILCVGYMANSIEEVFHQRYRSLAIQYSREMTPLGTGGALRLAMKLVPTETVLALNGDSYCHVDLSDFCAQHLTNGHEISLVGTFVEDVSRYGTLLINDDGTIKTFIEKQNNKTSGWINSGIYLFPKKLLCAEPETTPFSLEKEILPRWVNKGVFCYQKSAGFIDIGMPSSYKEAGGFFQKMEGKR